MYLREQVSELEDKLLFNSTRQVDHLPAAFDEASSWSTYLFTDCASLHTNGEQIIQNQHITVS